MNQTDKYPCPDGVHSLEKEGRWTRNSRHKGANYRLEGDKCPEERKSNQKIEIRSTWRGRNGSQQNGQGT